MVKLSRSRIAAYFADEIVAGRHDVARRLAAFLLGEQRVGELDLIVADIEYELVQRGIILADVTTALPADEGFEAAVRDLVGAGKHDTVVLREHVDPDLIGGIKIRASGKELDASIRHKLNQLKASSAA